MYNKFTLIVGIFFLSFCFASAYAEEVNTANELEIIEQHLHSSERWYGSCRSCGVGDYANESLQDFNCTSGANYYGTPVVIYGQLDMNDINITYPYLDLHRIFVNGSTSSANIRFRVLWGKDCTATAEADGNYSDVMTSIDELFKGDLVSVPAIMQMPQISTRQGIKICARCWSDTPNARISFFVGMHFYDNKTYTSDVNSNINESWYSVGLAILSVILMFLATNKFYAYEGFNILLSGVLRVVSMGLFLLVIAMEDPGVRYTEIASGLFMFALVIYFALMVIDFGFSKVINKIGRRRND